jgi:hypothetical protein
MASAYLPETQQCIKGLVTWPYRNNRMCMKGVEPRIKDVSRTWKPRKGTRQLIVHGSRLNHYVYTRQEEMTVIY